MMNGRGRPRGGREEEEVDFVFNDRGTQGASLKPDESEGCSPVSGGRTIRLCSSWPYDDFPTPLRPPVDTGAGDRGGALRQVCSGGGDCRLSKGC